MERDVIRTKRCFGIRRSAWCGENGLIGEGV